MGIRSALHRLRSEKDGCFLGKEAHKPPDSHIKAPKPAPRPATAPEEQRQASQTAKSATQSIKSKTDIPLSPSKTFPEQNTIKTSPKLPARKANSLPRKQKTKCNPTESDFLKVEPIGGGLKQTTPVFRAEIRWQANCVRWREAVHDQGVDPEDSSLWPEVPSVDSLFEKQVSKDGVGAIENWSFDKAIESNDRRKRTNVEIREMLQGIDPFEVHEGNGFVMLGIHHHKHHLPSPSELKKKFSWKNIKASASNHHLDPVSDPESEGRKSQKSSRKSVKL